MSLLICWEFVLSAKEDWSDMEDEEFWGDDIGSAFPSLGVSGGCEEVDDVEEAGELGGVFGDLREALVFSARRHCEPGICIAAA